MCGSALHPLLCAWHWCWHRRGSVASGNQWWFLAIPTFIAAGWLAVAEPERCLAKGSHRQGHDSAGLTGQSTGAPTAGRLAHEAPPADPAPRRQDVHPSSRAWLCVRQHKPIMPPPPPYPLEGGCDCKAVRYRMATAPLFVHCCHCRWCQRESGSAFALNAMIESSIRSHDPGYRTGARQHAFRQRTWTEDRKMPGLQGGRLEPLCRYRTNHQVRTSWHPRFAGPVAARRAHLHRVETAMGGACGQRPCFR